MSQLATAIVKEYFDPIIGAAQNDYMIARFQTPTAITAQLDEGYRYFTVAKDSGEVLGFLAFYPDGDRLYLSKFYLKGDQRGKGYAHAMLDFVIAAARAEKLPAIELNVYKHNDTATRVYEALGFKRDRAEANPIGNGFVMDDYVYRLELT